MVVSRWPQQFVRASSAITGSYKVGVRRGRSGGEHRLFCGVLRVGDQVDVAGLPEFGLRHLAGSESGDCCQACFRYVDHRARHHRRSGVADCSTNTVVSGFEHVADRVLQPRVVGLAGVCDLAQDVHQFAPSGGGRVRVVEPAEDFLSTMPRLLPADPWVA